jgi:hypothetical protein
MGRAEKRRKALFCWPTRIALNTCMNYRMLVTTFYGDLPQFKMFCHCLAKNWKGVPDLIVCIGAGENTQVYREITDSAFPAAWKIDIKESLHSYPTAGYTEMQVNTVYYSVTSGADAVIIWDCKDFVLKPCDLNMFVKDGQYRLTKRFHDIKMVDMGYDFTGFLDVPFDDLPGLNNIRPWIWNVEQLTRCWNYLNQRFGDCSTWHDFPGPGFFPGATEIYSYYVYAMKDPKRTIEFIDIDNQKYNALMYAGAYSNMTYENLLIEADSFNTWPDLVVWKHSRRHKDDPRFLAVTKSMLLKYGIDKDLIDHVYR